MSLIVAVKDGGRVYMGADTQTTSGKLICRPKMQDGTFKIAIMPNGVLLGHAGQFRCSQRLSLKTEWFENLPQDGITKRFLVKEIIPKFKDELKSINALDNGSANCTHLVVWRDRIFVIESDFSVLAVDNFVAIGSPDWAYPALMEEGKTVREKIIKALDVASKYMTTISPPYVLIDSQNLTFEVVKEEEI